jgi:biofilm PGA synthesis N-glycosyltransferase PgaC
MALFLAFLWATMFWVCLSIMFVAYIGFLLILKSLNLIMQGINQPDNMSVPDELPEIQIIVCCYNEENIIKNNIANKLEQDYVGKKSILVISDGSTDNSTKIVQEMAEIDKRIRLFSIETNCGKNNAINLAFNSGEFTGKFLCFTDVDTEFAPGILARAAGYFTDPHLGLVGGKISYWLGADGISQAEGAFWRLENAIREEEGNLGWLVSCSGGFIMMRRELFQPLSPEVNTDFALPLMVLAQGYASRFDKRAIIRSLFPEDRHKVLRRRYRTIIRALTTISLYRPKLPWHIRQVLFWHKTARFYAFPLQGAVFFANLALLSTSSFWFALFLAQMIFYGMAGLGCLFDFLNHKAPFVHLPYQFTLQNAVAFTAVIAFLSGKRVAKWTPPR